MENDHTTFVIEMIAVCTLALAGLLYQFHAWPHPWFLLAWAGAVFVGFSIYRGAAYTHRRFAPSSVQPDAQMAAAQMPAAQMAAPLTTERAAPTPEPAWSADDPSETDPTLMQPAVAPPATNRPHARATGAAGRIHTETAELRRETELDLVEPDAGPLPAFAESTLSGEERKQTLRTLLKDIGELKDPRKNAPQEEARVESTASPAKPVQPSDDPVHDATILTPIVGPPKKERPKKERPKKARPKKEESKKKVRPQKAAKPAKEFDPRATVLEPGRAHSQPQEVPANTRTSREPTAQTPSKNDPAQLGRRMQILDSDALAALRQRAAKSNPATPEKDEE